MYSYHYPRPAVTTDCIIIRKTGTNEEVLLIKRLHDPFKDRWALPGGFLDDHEDLHDGAIRELEEETGLMNLELHQFKTYGTPGRDPRGHTISVVFYGIVNNPSIDVKAGDDAAEANWFGMDKLPELAFDHQVILKDFMARSRSTE